MKLCSIPSLLFAVAIVCGTVTSSEAAPHKQPCASASHCSDAVTDWFIAANDYLKNGHVSPGKVPAIFCEVVLVGSIKPTPTLGGAKPDRFSVWYAQGEVKTEGLPLSVEIKGTLPMWLNSGDAKQPFGTQTNSTLNVVMGSSGGHSFNWQINGRNRLGQGPQSLSLTAETVQMTPDYLPYTGFHNFFGFKDISLALIRGEKDAAP